MHRGPECRKVPSPAASATVMDGAGGLGEKRPGLLQPFTGASSFQSFNAYFSSEHSRLLLLWRQVVGLRRLVSEAKMYTER